MPRRPTAAESGSSSSSSTLAHYGARYRQGHPSSSSLVRPRPLTGLNLHIIDAKLSTETNEAGALHALGESLGADVNTVPIEDADVIVTRVGVAKRLERHIELDKARRKPIVKPEWLNQCATTNTFEPFDGFEAIKSLQSSLPLTPDTQVYTPSFARRRDPPSTLSPSQGTGASISNASSGFDGKDKEKISASPNSPAIPRYTYSQSTPGPLSSPTTATSVVTAASTNPGRVVSHTQRLSTHRLSPLVCPNQALVEELAVIMRARYLDGESRSELSYARSIASLKAYPTKIRSSRELENIYFVGPKIIALVSEFLASGGTISASKRIRTSSRYVALHSFTSIYGIGSPTARRMYDVEGLRTLEDVERRYGERTVRVRDGAGHGEGEFELDGEGEKRDQYERKRKKARTHGTGEPGDAEGESGEEAAERPKDLMREQEVVLERADKRERVRAVMRRGFPLVDALRLGSELNTRMPRSEVEEITRIVMDRLDKIQSGFVHTICGGYRRGKTFCGDVDIILSRPEWNPTPNHHHNVAAYAKQLSSNSKTSARKGPDAEVSVCERLVRDLVSDGYITHVLYLSSFTSKHGLIPGKNLRFGKRSTFRQELDSLDKALTVFKMPESPGSSEVKHLHRRLDLVFAPWPVYWTAVVGWTGSTQFERDLRIWSKEHCGLKFDSTGMAQLENSKPVYAYSEEEVFEILDLPFIDPILRNANV